MYVYVAHQRAEADRRKQQQRAERPGQAGRAKRPSRNVCVWSRSWTNLLRHGKLGISNQFNQLL